MPAFNNFQQLPTRIAGHKVCPTQLQNTLSSIKDFDRVKLDYLKRVLEFLRFPPKEVEFICRTQDSGHAKLLNGRFVIQRSIPLRRGVRQGFGISPILYLLAAEPLLKKLEQKLNGIIYQPSAQFESGMPEAFATTVRIQAYADDTATFNSTAEDIVNTVLLVRRFRRFSGLEINFAKSFVFFTNNDKVQPLKNTLAVLMSSRTLKVESIDANPVYLGTPLLKTDWDSKLEALLNHFQRILFMGLNITQRCTGVRTYIYSKLFFYDQHDPIPMIKLEIFQREMVDLIMKFLPYKMSLTRLKKLLYVPIKKGGFGLMNLIQQVHGRRASYIKELLLFSKEANPKTRHVIHDIFSIQLQVLTNSFVRRQDVWWSIEHQINQEFGQVDSTDISFESVNNFANSLALPGYVSYELLLSIPFYYLLLPKIQVPSYMNDSEFRNSPRSLLDDPSEYKFNFSYFIRKKAALKRAERIRNERNSVNPNELTVKYMSTRPNAWTEPALEEPNDEFMVKFKDILTKVDDRFTKAPLKMFHFQHVHKQLNNAKEYDPMVHEKWKTIYPLADEQWSSFFKKLGTARIVIPFFVECYYQLQVGLLNKCFKSYCPLCSNVKDAVPGRIQHGLFECTAVDRLWTWVTGLDPSKRSPLIDEAKSIFILPS
ncbi:unnamed protein product [Ambrosiozyma monospora]|uniref:Unnamed protein product n=1 Tax=Ambrosiozyma monospora TaxID=43982 RepID=A0ACB5SRB1_AMBMO|nr:unnamed protein product [Ambrosiozyma monospora]